MDTRQRQHYKRKGLTDKEIDKLDICLAQCTSCMESDVCHIQDVLLQDNKIEGD